ncbi:MAG: hypothetical protein ACYDCI_05665 [Candidatus Limnocylindrales bacterium]
MTADFLLPPLVDRSDVPTSTLSEAQLIAAYGGLPERRSPADLIDVREMAQRAVAAAILEAEAKLATRIGGG